MKNLTEIVQAIEAILTVNKPYRTLQRPPYSADGRQNMTPLITS